MQLRSRLAREQIRSPMSTQRSLVKRKVSIWFSSLSSDLEFDANLVLDFDRSARDRHRCNPEFLLPQPSRPTVSSIHAFYIDLHRAGLPVKRQIALHRPPILTCAADLCGAKANFMKFSAIQNLRLNIVL